MKKKGLHCCGFRYQHTYNGKLIEGRGNFMCISTIYDLYFLWDWIGPFSRGSNRIRLTIHVHLDFTENKWLILFLIFDVFFDYVLDCHFVTRPPTFAGVNVTVGWVAASTDTYTPLSTVPSTNAHPTYCTWMYTHCWFICWYYHPSNPLVQPTTIPAFCCWNNTVVLLRRCVCSNPVAIL